MRRLRRMRPDVLNTVARMRLPFALLSLALLLVLPPRTAEARGAGADVWILNNKGTVEHSHQITNTEWIDLAGEMIIRRTGDQLVAVKLRGGDQKWAVAATGARDVSDRAWRGRVRGKPCIAILSHKFPRLLQVHMAKNGKRIHSGALGGQYLIGPLGDGRRWLEDAGTSLPVVQQQRARFTTQPQGQHEAERPPEIHQIQWHNGQPKRRIALRFQGAPDMLLALGPAMAVSTRGRCARYSSKSGRAHTAITDRVASYELGRDHQFVLTPGPAHVLLGWRTKDKHEPAWRQAVPLVGSRLVGHEGDRVWVAATGLLLEFDANDGKLMGRYRVPGLPLAPPNLWIKRTDKLTITSCGKPRIVRAFDPKTGELAWSKDGADVAGYANDTVILVSPGRDIPRRAVPGSEGNPKPPAVHGVDPLTGKERWRWNIPQPRGGYTDIEYVEIRPFGKDWVVVRDWVVHD